MPFFSSIKSKNRRAEQTLLREVFVRSEWQEKGVGG
jgi:hypothetical protein